MHVAADLNWFLQFIVVALVGAFGLLYLVRNTASRYFVVDSNFDSSAADYSSLDRRRREDMAEAAGGAAEGFDSCAVCGYLTKKQCARCKMVKYCSEACQKSHWDSEHKTKCADLLSLYKANTQPKSTLKGRKALASPVGGSSKVYKQSNKILFPYEEFLEFFNWDKPGYPPCGLLNCGNSCFANVVLQCLSYTRPLVAYLLEKGHRRECQRDDWCFLCEFQLHVERASRSRHPFSPMNILSRLPNIGGNLGYGKQEDAHEFMRFAIDMMQSVCLDEFGGEKTVHPSYQETTLIQHIFGGRLRSQVICAECNNVSNQFENMMDLTVEIHGDAGSLEECLDQFTAKEWLHGDNMYKCDGCNAYVMAWKRLTIQRAPNILTIALKRFQSGRFGKLNKRVTFPENLDLSPYMSELEDGKDVYKLYAVIVHVDMLNASFFGHYICYVKDFCGNWYRIDDCKVTSVDLDEVLSQGAYMLLYSRIRARTSCLLSTELLRKEESENAKVVEKGFSSTELADSLSDATSTDNPINSGQSLSADGSGFEVNREEEPSFATDAASTDIPPNSCQSLSADGLGVEVNSGEEPSFATDAASTDIPLNSCQSLSADGPGVEVNSGEEPSFATDAASTDIPLDSGRSPSSDGPGFEVNSGEEPLFTKDAEHSGEDRKVVSDLASPVDNDVELHKSEVLPTAQKEAASPIKVNNDPYPNNTPLIDGEISTQLDACIPDVGNTNGSKSNGNLTVESIANGICTFEEGSSVACNDSAMAGTSSDVQEKVDSPNSTSSLHGNVGNRNGISPSSSLDIHNAAEKSDRGRSSAAKSKPLFAPGFLDKKPRKKRNKLAKKVSSMELMPECQAGNNHSNEVTKSHLLHENGHVHGNGKASMESGICKNLKIGDSVTEI